MTRRYKSEEITLSSETQIVIGVQHVSFLVTHTKTGKVLCRVPSQLEVENWALANIELTHSQRSALPNLLQAAVSRALRAIKPT